MPGLFESFFFLWRPSLSDPKDDMVLELAVASRAQYIVTYNGKDFAAAERSGIQAVTGQGAELKVLAWPSAWGDPSSR